MNYFQGLINKEKNGRKKFTTLLRNLTACALVGMASTATALDVVIILDTTGSTGRLLPTWKANMDTAIVQPFKAVNPNVKFALVSHLDFPFLPHGLPNEYAYRLEAPLNADTTDFFNALNNLTGGDGRDVKESQFEAIFQAHTGQGLDLNGNGVFTDLGDIEPRPLGFNRFTSSVTILFTAPESFHNDPTINPNYPYPGVVNRPADFNTALAAITANDNTFFRITPDPLPSPIAGRSEKLSNIDPQTGTQLDSRAASLSVGPAARLATATGGRVLSAGSDLSGLADAIQEIIEITRPCPEGTTPVELPFGVVCVPNP